MYKKGFNKEGKPILQRDLGNHEIYFFSDGFYFEEDCYFPANWIDLSAEEYIDELEKLIKKLYDE